MEGRHGLIVRYTNLVCGNDQLIVHHKDLIDYCEELIYGWPESEIDRLNLLLSSYELVHIYL